MKQRKNVVVIGGGISGLCAARSAAELQHDCLLVEKCPNVGGLTRTIEVGDYCFDYTGHFLHLSHFGSPADIPYAGLQNGDWQRVTRKSFCYVAGNMIPAPIQYNIGHLPSEIVAECRQSYEQRPNPSPNGAATFGDFIIQGFGQYLADLFLIPQNEKTMAITIDRLSSNAIKRFFPSPVESLVRAGMNSTAPKADEYNSTFWYPNAGGIGRLVKGLATGLGDHLVCNPVTEINLADKKIQTTFGDFHWDVLFSSLPLKTLCQITEDPDLRAAGEQLSHSTTISFNIALKTPLISDLVDVHWIYVADRTIPFYRVGFYSNISQGVCTPGMSSLYAEVGISSEELCKPNIVNGLQASVIHSLEELGWINSRDIVCIAIHEIEHAYVHFTEERERLLPEIFARLHHHGVFPIGRYGLWDYMSMEDSIKSAISTVQEVLT